MSFSAIAVAHLDPSSDSDLEEDIHPQSLICWPHTGVTCYIRRDQQTFPTPYKLFLEEDNLTLVWVETSWRQPGAFLNNTFVTKGKHQPSKPLQERYGCKVGWLTDQSPGVGIGSGFLDISLIKDLFLQKSANSLLDGFQVDDLVLLVLIYGSSLISDNKLLTLVLSRNCADAFLKELKGAVDATKQDRKSTWLRKTYFQLQQANDFSRENGPNIAGTIQVNEIILLLSAEFDGTGYWF